MLFSFAFLFLLLGFSGASKRIESWRYSPVAVTDFRSSYRIGVKLSAI